MSNSIGNSVAAGSVLFSPLVVAALIGLGGVVVGLIARDLFMAAYLARRKRGEELADRHRTETKAHRDLVRLYADPLKEAVTSLRYRLNEIVEKKQARYLLADAPHIPFVDYKRISTLYRIAAVLGWIRAIRRERSYLDPDETSASVEMAAIGKFEAALADGGHVELQRLDELTALWGVALPAAANKAAIASMIDGARADYLAGTGSLAARDLTEEQQGKLAIACADIVRREAGVEFPEGVVAGEAVEAAVILGIKEAYVYRDWQAAIGDMMLVEDAVGARHFSVMGFGRFEALYLSTRRTNKKRSIKLRWFDRLEAIIHDLDMTATHCFDARRAQVFSLYNCCGELEAVLAARVRPATAPAPATSIAACAEPDTLG